MYRLLDLQFGLTVRSLLWTVWTLAILAIAATIIVRP